MSIPVSNPAPYSSNLLGSTNDLITQFKEKINNIHEESFLSGGKKDGKIIKKKVVSKPKVKKVADKPKVKKVADKPKVKKVADKRKVKKVADKPKVKKVVKKVVKKIDTMLKPKLEKMAKKHGVSLKKKDGTVKTKQQLFNSLKRKKLV